MPSPSRLALKTYGKRRKSAISRSLSVSDSIWERLESSIPKSEATLTKRLPMREEEEILSEELPQTGTRCSCYVQYGRQWRLFYSVRWRAIRGQPGANEQAPMIQAPSLVSEFFFHEDRPYQGELHLKCTQNVYVYVSVH